MEARCAMDPLVEIQYTAAIGGGRAPPKWKVKAVRISDDVYAVRLCTLDCGFSRYCCGKTSEKRPLVYKGDLIKTIKDLRDAAMINAIARPGQKLVDADSETTGWRTKKKVRADQTAVLDARSDSLPDTVTVRLPAFGGHGEVDCEVAVPKAGLDSELEKRANIFIVPTSAALEYIKAYMYNEFEREQESQASRPKGAFTRQQSGDKKLYIRTKSDVNKCGFKCRKVAIVPKGSDIGSAFARASARHDGSDGQEDSDGQELDEHGDSSDSQECPVGQEAREIADLHQESGDKHLGCDSLSTSCPDTLDSPGDLTALGGA